jgi:hypothetical protein
MSFELENYLFEVKLTIIKKKIGFSHVKFIKLFM